MHLFTCLILCAVFIIVMVDLKEITTKFVRNYSLDGSLCTETKSLFTFNNLGRASCANECSKTFTCIGIFFVPASGLCIGCSSQFDPGVTEPLAGSIFYTRIHYYAYLGCYYDGLPHRILAGPMTESKTMTFVDCLYFCFKEGNYTHMLVEDGIQCFCGNGFVLPVVQAWNCQSLCAGNPSQHCGGSNQGSVFLIDY